MLPFLSTELLKVRIVTPGVSWFRNLGPELVVFDGWFLQNDLAKIVAQHLSKLDLILWNYFPLT